MEINGKNITKIITHLYSKRLGSVPTPDVLESWSNLSDAEAQMHLMQLFKTWGYNEQQIAEELYSFQSADTNEQTNHQPETQHTASTYYENTPHHTQSEPNKPYEPTISSNNNTNYRKKKSPLRYLFLILLLAVGAYGIFKYTQFKNLGYLYVTTDNVSIRDHEGKNIGRMDIFADKNSVSFLRTTDNKSYPIQVGENMYQCRRVVFDSTSFIDFLFNKPEAFGYVNENYVIDDKDNFIVYRNVFKSINNVKAENSSLTSAFRKVIVGSIRQNPSMTNLFIQNTCNNNNKNFTSLIKHKTSKGIFQVVAFMSDGNYYIFTGNPESQSYQAPQPFLYKLANSENANPFNNESILFKYVNRAYFLFNCDGTARDYYTTFKDDGTIDYAKYSFEP